MTARLRRSDPLALASVALAILWLFGLGSLAAIALGYGARRRGTESPVLALVGIWLGALGVAIGVAFLATTVAPDTGAGARGPDLFG